MSDLVFARNCSMARMLPGEAELVSKLTGLPGRAKSVKRFERSNGPDIALYKNCLYLFFSCHHFFRSDLLLVSCPSMCCHFRARAFARSVTAMRSPGAEGSSSSRQ